MRCTAHTSAKKTEYNKRIKTRSLWAPKSESASTSKCMTPTLGTRPASSVGLATNWRLSTIDNQTHPDRSFDRQRFLYGRLSICFSSCIFHSCIFHHCYLLLLFPLLHFSLPHFQRPLWSHLNSWGLNPMTIKSGKQCSRAQKRICDVSELKHMVIEVYHGLQQTVNE